MPPRASLNAHAGHNDDNRLRHPPAGESLTVIGTKFRCGASSWDESSDKRLARSAALFVSGRYKIPDQRRSAPQRSGVNTLRGHVLAAMPDPAGGQFFLHRVLREPRLKRREIDRVERLILVEAGEDVTHHP